MTEPLYDVEAALRTLAKQRRKVDQLSLATTELADRLANHLRAHFGPEALETVGLALVLGSASVAVVATGVNPAVAMNVLAFSGQRLVADARAADEAARSGEDAP